MAVYAFYFNGKMNVALRTSKDRIGDVNAQLEDTLAGIRVVKSFTNEEVEKQKFAVENSRFLESRRDGYKSEAYFFNGVVAFTQLFTVVVIVFGGASIVRGSLDLADLVTYFALYRHPRVVQQDVYLFAGTVADNIRYGKPDAGLEDIVAAAKKANAHDFVMALPDGYATDVGQRGVKLSGGQKQRLSVARVFLKNPPILIFDEATSALDNDSEQAVQAALETLSNQRTTLVIAHRLSTVRNAHRIIVLTDGVAEQGTHEALLARGGVYANLYAMHSRL